MMNKQSNKGSEPFKIFVGGLSPHTTEGTLADYFGNFGPLADKVVMSDKEGRPRGFGFVTYQDEESFKKCLNSRPHFVDDKQVDAKAAVPKNEQYGGFGGGSGFKAPQSETTDKVFLGGLSASTSEQEIKVALGLEKISDVTIMKTEEKKPRGFGFATFHNSTDVDQLLNGNASVHIKIKDRDVEVKRARPQVPGGGQRTNRGGYSGGGGRGGGYGYQGGGGYGPGGGRGGGGYQGNGMAYPGGGPNYAGNGGGYPGAGGGGNYQGAPNPYQVGGYPAAAPYQQAPPAPASGGYYGVGQTQTPPAAYAPAAGGYGAPPVPAAGPPVPAAPYGAPPQQQQQQQQQQPPPQQPPVAAQPQQQQAYAQGYDAAAYGAAAAYSQQPPAPQAPPAAPQAPVAATPPVGGVYGQAPSNFGPSRGGMAGKPGGGGYHPYARGGGAR